MAEALVLSVIQKLNDPVINKGYFLRGVSGKVVSVREKLQWIQSVLRDAESRSNEEEVLKIWVEKIREVAYRIEDAIDVYVLEIRGIKGPIMKPAALHKLSVELDDIETILKEIKENGESFKIDERGGSSRGNTNHFGRPTLLQFCHESRTVGLEADKEAIIKKLLDPQNPTLHVISIVGTGGLRKTTLAEEVFNSTEVKQNFDTLIWLSLSQEIEVYAILKKMERVISGRVDEDIYPEYLVQLIKNHLKNTRFLIVLDDVWSETFWPEIRVVCPPENEMNCGRVVITTRDLNVAEKADSEPYQLQFLKPEKSKMLLYKVSFPNHVPPYGLDTVAGEIASKCGGLPIAIVVSGGRLYMEHKHSQWHRVAESMDWEGCEYMKTLSASYDDLSIILKTCFMYLASFPEDVLIDAQSLIRILVADDVVPDVETGNTCLQQLAQRSFIIVRATSYDGLVVNFCVHDLLLDLAITKAKDNKFLSVFIQKNLDQSSFHDTRHHASQSCNFSQNNNTSQNERQVMRNYNRKQGLSVCFSTQVFVGVHQKTPEPK